MKRLAFVLVLLCCLLGAAQADTEIARYAMDIQVLEDGAAEFVETITYRHDGGYNGMLATIRHEEDMRLADLRIFVDGAMELELVPEMDRMPYTFTAESDGDHTDIKTYTPGGEGERTYRISYRINGWAQRFADTSRINHRLLYAEMTYEQAVFTIALPGTDDGEVLVFVHGATAMPPVSVESGRIAIGPARVGEDAIVEVDVLFPQAWLAAARTIQTPMREEALAQEAEIARELAEAQERAERIERIAAYVVLALLAVYAVVCLVAFLRMRAKYGVKHALTPTTDEALLAQVRAAEAQVIRENSVSSSGFSATLLELVEAGALRMHEDEGDTAFTVLTRPAGLRAYQESLLDWLFEDRPMLHSNDLDAGDDYEAAKEFNERYNKWKGEVSESVLAQGWVFGNQGARMMGVLLPLVCGAALTFFLFRYGLWPVAIPAALLTVCFAVLFGRIRRLTDTGEACLAALDGFVANYRDKLETAPKTMLRHVPLAMALGYMDPLAEWMDESPQQPEYAQDWTPVWMYYGWHHDMRRMDRNLREVQSNNAKIVSDHDSSSSSGSGGGFSSSSGGSSHGSW